VALEEVRWWHSPELGR
jgi:hypothetical protein